MCRTRVAARVLIAVAVIVTSCESASTHRPSSAGSSIDAGSAAPAPDKIRTDLPTVGKAWAIALPFALNDADNKVLYSAWQKSIADCMKAHGFSYIPTLYPDGTVIADVLNPLDSAYALTHGYHSSQPTYVDNNRTQLSNPAFEETLSGDSGCAAKSQSDSYGTIREFISASDSAFSAFGQFIAGFDKSAVGLATAKRWSDCMKQGGYSFVNPLAALLNYAEKSSISKEEIKTRMFDYDCDVKIGFTDARHEWEKARVDSWLHDNEGVVTDLIRQKKEADATIKALSSR